MVTCAQFFIYDADYYVMLIFLNFVESELIYMENKECHWRMVYDIWWQRWDRDCQWNNHIPRCFFFFFFFYSLATERELGKGLHQRVYDYTE